MPSPYEVVVVGSIMQDLILVCDAFPLSGQTIMGRLRTGQGGKGSNQAIASGRAGARTLFVGAVGNDSYPGSVRAFYAKEKIGCFLVEKKNQNTGTAVILLDRSGQNEIIIEPGANTRLAFADLPADLLTGARVLIAQFESNLATTTSVLRAARKLNVTTILNPAPMRADFNPAILKYVDILIPNETEFVALVRAQSKIHRPDFNEVALHALSGDELHGLCRQFGVPTLIVTLGSKGCFVSEPTKYLFIPAHQGIEVVDTTGAGDAFCGGFAAGLVRHSGDRAAAARFGTAVAALSVTKAGAAYAMPTQTELHRFLRRNGS